jgi:hypothetical protein
MPEKTDKKIKQVQVKNPLADYVRVVKTATIPAWTQVRTRPEYPAIRQRVA